MSIVNCFLDDYIRKVVCLLKENHLVARQMENSQKRYDNFGARLFFGQALQTGQAFAFKAAYDLFYFFLKGHDFFSDRLRLQCQSLETLEKRFDRVHKIFDLQAFAGVKKGSTGRTAACQKIGAAEFNVSVAPKF